LTIAISAESSDPRLCRPPIPAGQVTLVPFGTPGPCIALVSPRDPFHSTCFLSVSQCTARTEVATPSIQKRRLYLFPTWQPHWLHRGCRYRRARRQRFVGWPRVGRNAEFFIVHSRCSNTRKTNNCLQHTSKPGSVSSILRSIWGFIYDLTKESKRVTRRGSEDSSHSSDRLRTAIAGNALEITAGESPWLEQSPGCGSVRRACHRCCARAL
jgi:hypothetical protein